MKPRYILFSTFLSFALLPAVAQQPKSAPAPTQTPSQQDDVVKITTNLVQIDAVVTDKNGKHVTDLQPDDFDIRVDGKPQKITNFTYVSVADQTITASEIKKAVAVKNAPPVPSVQLNPKQVRRVIAIVIDDLGLSFRSMADVKIALGKFIETQMQPDDLVAIIETSGTIGALEHLTNDKQQLRAAVANMRWNAMGHGGIVPVRPIVPDIRSEHNHASLIRLEPQSPAQAPLPNLGPSGLDRLIESGNRPGASFNGSLNALQYVVEGLRSLPGRKSILFVSDGLPVHPDEAGPRRVSDSGQFGDSLSEQMRRVIEAANRASVSIYTMNATGLQYFGLRADDNLRGMAGNSGQLIIAQINMRQTLARLYQEGLDYLADQTGGLSIKNTNDLNRGIERVLNDQAGYYLIGYRPDESTFESQKGERHFHKIALKVLHHSSLHARYRNGFYGFTDEEARVARAVDPTPGGTMFRALMSPFMATGVTLHLTSLFANQANEGSVLRAMIHVDASGLTFKQETDGWYSADFDLLAITFGNNGRIMDRVARTHSLKLRGDNYEAVLKNGFVYHVTIPLKQSGPLFVRVALRDHVDGKIGSAGQFMEVPDLSQGHLTLSGIQLDAEPSTSDEKATTTVNSTNGLVNKESDNASAANPQYGPGVRHFRAGMILRFGYIIYNANLNSITSRPQLLTQVRLFRDGQQVYASETTAYDSSKQADLGRLIEIGSVRLGSNLLPGDYMLQILIRDALAKDKYNLAMQSIDFEIEK